MVDCSADIAITLSECVCGWVCMLAR